MLLNLSNHPSSKWDEVQRSAAKAAFGMVEDIPFPVVPPDADAESVAAMAEELAAELLERLDPKQDGVHVMGEMTLTFALVARLQRAGIRCVASTTERLVVENAATGEKTTRFRFVRLRDYPRLPT